MDAADQGRSERRVPADLRSWGLTIYGHGSVPGVPEIDTVDSGR